MCFRSAYPRATTAIGDPHFRRIPAPFPKFFGRGVGRPFFQKRSPHLALTSPSCGCLQHILNKDSVPRSGIADEHVRDCTDKLPILYNRTAAHVRCSLGTTVLFIVKNGCIYNPIKFIMPHHIFISNIIIPFIWSIMKIVIDK